MWAIFCIKITGTICNMRNYGHWMPECMEVFNYGSLEDLAIDDGSESI